MRFLKLGHWLSVSLVLSLIAAPSLWDAHGFFNYSAASAASNGNGKSNAGNNGNAGGNSASPKTQSASQGSTASALGSLNAAHASAKAFAHASPNSEIGKIKAYYLANQTALTAQATFDNALALTGKTLDQFTTVLTAYTLWQADPTNTTLQANYTTALTTAGLTDASFQVLATDYSTAQHDAQTAQTLLDAASNKGPVSQQTKAALDLMLSNKNIGL